MCSAVGAHDHEMYSSRLSSFFQKHGNEGMHSVRGSESPPPRRLDVTSTPVDSLCCQRSSVHYVVDIYSGEAIGFS